MLGFDGKWVLHPGQIERPTRSTRRPQEDYDHAELILDAYEHGHSEAGGKKGSAMLGDEMIDEASAKMALVIAGKGRAAGWHVRRPSSRPRAEPPGQTVGIRRDASDSARPSSSLSPDIAARKSSRSSA